MANEEDLALVHDALAGDPAACKKIGSDEMCGWIEGVLVKRGASPTEAKDITADVFGDCFGRSGEKAPLLKAYNGGGPGYAQTQTRSGPVSFGQGVAFGVDRDGVSFSASQAVATPHGPAVATTFNLTVGFNGQTASSQGLSVAGGSRQRQARASGSTGLRHGRPTAISRAGGRTGHRGFVRAKTRSRSTQFRRMRPRSTRHIRPRWRR